MGQLLVLQHPVVKNFKFCLIVYIYSASHIGRASTSGLLQDSKKQSLNPPKSEEQPQTSCVRQQQHPVSRMSDLQKGNTRRPGKELKIQLKKDASGLGFTVTSRDNALDGQNFTCVKNILQNGVAQKDGRLREGDRLLKVKIITYVVQSCCFKNFGQIFWVCIVFKNEFGQSKIFQYIYIVLYIISIHVCTCYEYLSAKSNFSGERSRRV